MDKQTYKEATAALKQSGIPLPLQKEIQKSLDRDFNKKGKWIPCSERLPEESLNSVLGWDEYRDRCCFVQYLNGKWVLGNDIESVKITAWQPLPEPYQESCNEGGTT